MSVSIQIIISNLLERILGYIIAMFIVDQPIADVITKWNLTKCEKKVPKESIHAVKCKYFVHGSVVMLLHCWTILLFSENLCDFEKYLETEEEEEEEEEEELKCARQTKLKN
jgi:hypothetical protein